MKKLVSMMMVAAATLVLASCGGGTGSGPLTGSTGTPTGTGTAPSVKSMTVTTSMPQIPSDGSKTATISALLRDANNNVMANVPVSFQASSGALTVTQGTTGTNGTATATLSSAGDPSNRTITVTATVGSSTATVPVSVVGTKLTLSGPTSLVLGNTGNFTAALQDSAGNGISGQTATVASAKDNTVNPATFTTDANGQGAFTVTAVNSGTDTITASAAGLKATQSLSVSSDAFSFTAPAANTNINIGTNATVTVVWKNSGNPVAAGTPITFAATRGTLNGSTLSSATASTDSSGSASVTVISNTSGPSVISASGANGVSAQLVVNFVATTPSTMDVQANPTTIPTQGQSTITATVRDANNNLVQGQTVNFSIAQDSTGGTLSVASAQTNGQGQASTTYTASTTTSSTNGVVISASVPGVTFNPATSTTSASLTVAGQTVFLSLGTGNTISALNSTQYSMPFTVQAVDSSGNPVPGIKVTFAVQSLGYIKGCALWNGVGTCGANNGAPTGSGQWEVKSDTSSTDLDLYTLDGYEACITEDADNDGIEDSNYNSDANIIWPGQVASTDVGSATTDASGTASVNLIYPKDHAWYVAVQLTASATSSGSQSSSSTKFWLPALTSDINSPTQQPPGLYSPYGMASTCAQAN